MKAVIRLLIDPKTGKPLVVPWFGEGEPPAIVDQMSGETSDEGAEPIKEEPQTKRKKTRGVN